KYGFELAWELTCPARRLSPKRSILRRRSSTDRVSGSLDSRKGLGHGQTYIRERCTSLRGACCESAISSNITIRILTNRLPLRVWLRSACSPDGSRRPKSSLLQVRRDPPARLPLGRRGVIG